VPYVRISLLIATRWKPLPPRHFCGNQAYHHTLAAPVLVTFHPAVREGQLSSRSCNVRFMLRPVKLLALLRRPPLLSRESGYFYFRACLQSVTLMRVGYNYLGEQTIPRVGLSPTGNAALWAAHAELRGRERRTVSY